MFRILTLTMLADMAWREWAFARRNIIIIFTKCHWETTYIRIYISISNNFTLLRLNDMRICSAEPEAEALFKNYNYLKLRSRELICVFVIIICCSQHQHDETVIDKLKNRRHRKQKWAPHNQKSLNDLYGNIILIEIHFYLNLFFSLVLVIITTTRHFHISCDRSSTSRWHPIKIIWEKTTRDTKTAFELKTVPVKMPADSNKIL